MPKVSVYVPDDLYAAVRKHRIPISAVAQHALEAEVRRHANVDWVAGVRARPPRVQTEIDTAALIDDVRSEFDR
jgi:post-segregation antitoxin (ccd killing protein)